MHASVPLAICTGNSFAEELAQKGNPVLGSTVFELRKYFVVKIDRRKELVFKFASTYHSKTKVS